MYRLLNESLLFDLCAKVVNECHLMVGFPIFKGENPASEAEKHPLWLNDELNKPNGNC